MDMRSKIAVIFVLNLVFFLTLKPFLVIPPFYTTTIITFYSINYFRNTVNSECVDFTSASEDNIYFKKYAICIAGSLKSSIFNTHKNEQKKCANIYF